MRRGDCSLILERDARVTFDDLIGVLREVFDRDVDSTSAGLRLVEDLQLDSVELYELMVIIGKESEGFGEDALIGAKTVGDVYQAYGVSLGARR